MTPFNLLAVCSTSKIDSVADRRAFLMLISWPHLRCATCWLAARLLSLSITKPFKSDFTTNHFPPMNHFRRTHFQPSAMPPPPNLLSFRSSIAHRPPRAFVCAPPRPRFHDMPLQITVLVHCPVTLNHLIMHPPSRYRRARHQTATVRHLGILPLCKRSPAVPVSKMRASISPPPTSFIPAP